MWNNGQGRIDGLKSCDNITINEIPALYKNNV